MQKKHKSKHGKVIKYIVMIHELKKNPQNSNLLKLNRRKKKHINVPTQCQDGKSHSEL